jgi:hypothetical protein
LKNPQKIFEIFKFQTIEIKNNQNYHHNPTLNPEKPQKDPLTPSIHPPQRLARQSLLFSRHTAIVACVFEFASLLFFSPIHPKWIFIDFHPSNFSLHSL